MGRSLVIADYDPDWPRLFEREAGRVLAACPAVRRVEHVGSTAVPGLAASPTVDLLAGVDEPGALDAAPLLALGYAEADAVRQREPGRRFFWKGTVAFPTFHLHAVRLGGPLWGRHLLFRDRLRADLDLAERYAHHKRQIARLYGDDAEAYAEAKTAFVDAALQTAGPA